MRDSEPEHIYKGCYEIWQDSHQQNEFSKLCRTPGAFQVFAAIQYRCTSDKQCDDILLSKSCCNINPWIE